MNKGRSSGRVFDAGAEREQLGLTGNRVDWSSQGGGGGASRGGGRSGGFGQQVQRDKNEVIAEQDEILDEIERGVTQVGAIAKGINTQISEQQRELEIIEDGMNRANTNMDHVTRRTKALVDSAGGKRQFCIQVFLGVVALVLLLLVIYT